MVKVKAPDNGGRMWISSVRHTAADFLENISIHGFNYWVDSESKTLGYVQRFFWIVITLLSFLASFKVLYDSAVQWQKLPTVVAIDSFSLPVTDLYYPAVTVCKRSPYDVGEYLRAIYDNFQMDCCRTSEDNTKLLREHFPGLFVFRTDLRAVSFPVNMMFYIEKWASHRNLAAAFSNSAFNDTVGFLMPFYFGPGPKLTGSTVSRILLGASLASYSNNAKWDALAGLFYWAGTEPSMRQMYPAMWQKPCQNFIVLRYLALCTHINSNPRFWAALTACQQTRNPSPNNATLKVMSALTVFDVFVVGESMRHLGSFSAFIMAKAFTYAMMGGHIQDGYPNYAIEFTEYANVSYAKVTSDLGLFMMKAKFLQQMWLPESDFGKMLSNLPSFDYYKGLGMHGMFASGTFNTGTEYATIAAYNTFWKAIFPSYNAVNPHHWPPSVLPKFFHPLFLADLFVTNPVYAVDEFITYSVAELPKILMFSSYVRAQNRTRSTTIEEIILSELQKYNYSTKPTFKIPYFSPLDASTTPRMFHPSVTDAGICHVYNGNSMNSTFAPSERTTAFQEALDPRTETVIPAMINGTGKIYEVTFWLNIADRSLRSQMPIQPPEKSSAVVAINQWLSYFNVRWNNFEIFGGQDVVVKINPVDHNATGSFRELEIKERKCRYYDEMKSGSMFSYYTEKGCLFQCRLEYTIRRLGCVPWNYPIPPGPGFSNVTMCKSSDPVRSVAAFEAMMNTPEAVKNCSCEGCCEEVMYDFQVNTMELDTNRLCNVYGDWGTIDRVMRDWQETNSPLVYWSKQITPSGNYMDRYKTLDFTSKELASETNISYGLPTAEAISICKHRYQYDFAKLTLQIAKPKVMQIMRDVRVSFSDQVAVVGGTLGLFAGASLISLIEIVFWIYKAIARSLQSALCYTKARRLT